MCDHRRPCSPRGLPAYPVVISGVGVLVTGDDFRRHPVRRADKGVPAADGSVQLGADSKIH